MRPLSVKPNRRKNRPMNTQKVKDIAIALHTETKQGDHLKPPPWKASGNFTQSDADACNAAEAAREQAREAGNIAIRQKREVRLEYLRGELQAERISYGELAELQSLAQYIKPGDVELLEAAGVPEVPEQMTPTRACEIIKAEMEFLKRQKPSMPKCQMQRLGLRFDWNVVYEALQP